jgi:hypothetical protein
MSTGYKKQFDFKLNVLKQQFQCYTFHNAVSLRLLKSLTLSVPTQPKHL